MIGSVRTVAICDTHADTVEMLQSFLARYSVRALDGGNVSPTDLAAFMRSHTPDAVVWNIEPPYAHNWDVFHAQRLAGPLSQRPVVLTTTGERELRRLAGAGLGSLEVVAKPSDPQAVLDALVRAMGRPGVSTQSLTPMTV